MPRLKITYKMAIILATMSFGPMLAGGISGMIPFENNQTQRERQEVSRELAVNCSSYLSNKDNNGLQKSCRAALIQNAEIRSLSIIRHDGMVLYASPDHNRYWTLKPEEPSNINQVRVPLDRGNKTFAELEIAFEPSKCDVWFRIDKVVLAASRRFCSQLWQLFVFPIPSVERARSKECRTKTSYETHSTRSSVG